MAKLKKATLSMNNKEKAFVYEIVGIASLITSIIALARFGLIGKYLVLTFSLLFGDWYFIFIILMGVFGVYCLLFHKKIEIKSVRYYGVILILISLLTITHFGMHDYVSQFEGNALKITLNIYFDYFKSNSTQMIKGGGIIGCLFFYIFYILLGKVGTVIISLLVFFIGIVFLMKKTMREFVEMNINIVKKIQNYFKKSYTNLVNNVKEISSDYIQKDKTTKIKKSKYIKKSKDIVDDEQIQRSEEILKILNNTFNHLEVVVENITYLICEHIVVYFINSKQEINYKVLEYSLRNKLDENFMIKYDKYNEQIIIEVNKINPKSLSFSKALKNISKQELSIILGIDDRNLLIELDDNLLIIGENQKLMKHYVTSIITFLTIQKKFELENFKLCDFNKMLDNYVINNIEVIKDIDYLNNIIDEIDENLELLNLHHKVNVDEYNMYFSKKIIKKYYFIYGIEHIIYKKGYFDKLLYIVQTGHSAGVNVVLTLSSNVNLSSILFGSIDKKIMLYNKFDITQKVLEQSYFDLLSKGVEAFYKDKDLIIRISLLLMSEEEVEKHFPFKENSPN